MARIGVYPGSFNPPTVAHLAIARAAKEQRNLDRVVLVHSADVLGKAAVARPLFAHRHRVLEATVSDHAWLEVAVTEHRRLVDIAAGYDVVIMGADKWHQIQELHWYEPPHPTSRDAALAALPEPAVAPRHPLVVPAGVRLELARNHPCPGGAGSAYGHVSSTAARAGRTELMAPAARRFAMATGAWIEPERYERWLAETGQLPATDPVFDGEADGGLRSGAESTEDGTNNRSSTATTRRSSSCQ
ncbi:MAG: nicotinate-nicotinamide nucleotide adenylyltransferase [Acidimicrobiales bacterium]